MLLIFINFVKLNQIFVIHLLKQNYSTKPKMRKILIIGSGKSSSYLLKYLLDKSISENLFITVGDLNIENAQKLLGSHKNAEAISLASCMTRLVE